MMFWLLLQLQTYASPACEANQLPCLWWRVDSVCSQYDNRKEKPDWVKGKVCRVDDKRFEAMVYRPSSGMSVRMIVWNEGVGQMWVEKMERLSF